MNAKLVSKIKIFVLLSVVAVLAAACQPAAVSTPEPPAATVPAAAPTTAALTPSVTVSDQSADGGSLLIADVVSDGPGWLVIHADASGSPGPVLGYSAVANGDNKDVKVTIDDSEATAVLYAMLHTDAGTVGTYEFPGADGPVKVDGQMVSPAFNVTGIKASSSGSDSGKDDTGYGDDSSSDSTPQASAGDSVTLKVASNTALGKFLVDGKGMTLYLFTKDTPGVSNCSGGCLQAWPPLLVTGDPVAGEGVTGKLGVIVRDDGTHQVTYNDLPLYYYATDVKPGDTTGQEVGGVWFVVAP